MSEPDRPKPTLVKARWWRRLLPLSPYALAVWTVLTAAASAGWQIYEAHQRVVAAEAAADKEAKGRAVAQAEADLARKEAREEAALSRRVESQQPFLKRKLDTFFEAIQAAGKLTDNDLEPKSLKWQDAANRFWQLRWGELEMVGDPGVRDAARRVGQQIVEMEYEPSRDRRDLRWAVECLADELRLATEHAWGIDNVSQRMTALPSQAPVSKLPSGCTLGNRPPTHLEGMAPLMAPGNSRALMRDGNFAR
ncbi:hypothetical protein [Tardiphaga sp. P9-11]|uniref:hypothetical protein n=1 Tax=Tardiphaga sp. P9-11 TaxID=2024614 RepID=UPI0011F303A6|nr:hypothetical protein [Tardiphaga sp. P9-11]KAA0069965.1 hypothetical protein CIW50_27740 [Tardiphaga sp. P9-11]